MLDLSSVKKQTYSIKLPDKEILKIKKPSQGIYIKLKEFQDIHSGSDDLEIIEALYEVLTDVFNRNINDRVFTVNDLKAITDNEPTMVALIIEDYLKFVETELKK